MFTLITSNIITEPGSGGQSSHKHKNRLQMKRKKEEYNQEEEIGSTINTLTIMIQLEEQQTNYNTTNEIEQNVQWNEGIMPYYSS